MKIVDLEMWLAQFKAWEKVTLDPNEACLEVKRKGELFYLWPDNGQEEHWKLVKRNWVKQP